MGATALVAVPRQDRVGGPVAINWVAVKELKLSYHNGYIYIYIVNNRVSPI